MTGTSQFIKPHPDIDAQRTFVLVRHGHACWVPGLPFTHFGSPPVKFGASGVCWSQGMAAVSIQRPKSPSAWMRSGAGMTSAGTKAGSSERSGGIASSRSLTRGESFSEKLTHDFTASYALLPSKFIKPIQELFG
jgi:hypothetical protein